MKINFHDYNYHSIVHAFNPLIIYRHLQAGHNNIILVQSKDNVHFIGIYF